MPIDVCLGVGYNNIHEHDDKGQVNTAGMVRQSKERHPEQFCAVPRCLWRIKGHDGSSRTPCAKHPRAGLLSPMGAILGIPAELAAAISREKEGNS